MMFGHGSTEVFAEPYEESLLDEVEHDGARGVDWPADDEGASELIAPGAVEAHVVAWADYGPADGLRLRRVCVPLGLAAVVGVAALITTGTLDPWTRQRGHSANAARAERPSVATGGPVAAPAESIRIPAKRGGRPVRRARLVLSAPKPIAPVHGHATPDRGIRSIQAAVRQESTAAPRVPPVPEPRAPVETGPEIKASGTPPAAGAPHASTEATHNQGGGAFTLGG
jgi:hypothetical protein